MRLSPSEALEKIKKFWGDAPVNVFGAATALGLGPKRDFTLPNHVSGAIKRDADDNWLIIYNGNHPEVRQRFTVAHEIGHFIYHRAKLEACDGTSDTLAFRIDGDFYPNKFIGPREEWQANTFAANLLIPNHALRLAQSFGITDESELAKSFNVSLAAMRIKLGSSQPPDDREGGYNVEADEQEERDQVGFDRL